LYYVHATYANVVQMAQCGNVWDTEGKREKTARIPRPRYRTINKRLRRKL